MAPNDVPVLGTRIDVTSKRFAENAEQMRALLHSVSNAEIGANNEVVFR